jgi:hypothetical protein
LIDSDSTKVYAQDIVTNELELCGSERELKDRENIQQIAEVALGLQNKTYQQ